MAERKAEIQGLRAIAVGSVLLFHIWPNRIPGGYVGVDVFFVISGYLITGLLLREVEASGRISILKFYERRVRRLLPAATLVLIAVAIALPLLPSARWEDTAYEIVSSALYVENWRLAAQAVDYLGAENVASPVQHYWSLSIEEQFYIVWPLLMIAGLAFGAASRFRRVIIWPLVILMLGSFAASIYLTATNPAAAYFVTQTRIWELALGGCLAIVRLPSIPPAGREAMRVLGLTMIAVSCFAFTTRTPFPGYAALLPTLGAVLVIAAGKSDAKWSSYKLLALRPAQYLGDISYSVYLWHWPLIVLALVHAPGGRISAAIGLLIVAVTVVISHFSKRYIEDPFRHPGAPVRAVLSGATSIAVVVAAASLVIFSIGNQQSGEALAADSERYPGAAAFLAGAAVPQVKDLVPPITLVKTDLPDAYERGCHLDMEKAKLSPCTFGSPGAPFRVLLVGDSHAANWIPAIEELALTHNWRVETHTKSACPLLVAPVVRDGGPYTACYEWGQALLQHIGEEKPDLVIVAQAGGFRLNDDTQPKEAVLARTWQAILDMDVPVAAIVDTPHHEVNPAECVERDRACASPRAEVLPDDVTRTAQAAEPRVALIDMTDGVCDATICPMVIGNVMVWRDEHHLTKTYARTLAPFLGNRLLAAVGRD
jgi:peptidoglycan/LPS O-acetylase OafA/YrhL